MYNLEAQIIKWLNEEIDVKVCHTVPKNTPSEFVTVERTGGKVDSRSIDRATLAVQAWAKTPSQAAALAYKLRDIFAKQNTPNGIYSVKVQELYEFVDMKTNRPRYQIILSVVAII